MEKTIQKIAMDRGTQQICDMYKKQNWLLEEKIMMLEKELSTEKRKNTILSANTTPR